MLKEWYSRNFPAPEIRGILLEEVTHEPCLEYGLTLHKRIVLLREQKPKAGSQDVSGTRRYETLDVHSV